MRDIPAAQGLLAIGAITLFVEDVGAARQFYTGVPGLPIHYQDEDSAVFGFGDDLVNLLRVEAAHELVEPASVGAPEAGPRFQLTINGPDVDGTCAELARRGIALLNGPMDRPWGVRTASLRDQGRHAQAWRPCAAAGPRGGPSADARP